jgi:hypothetical protein
MILFIISWVIAGLAAAYLIVDDTLNEGNDVYMSDIPFILFLIALGPIFFLLYTIHKLVDLSYKLEKEPYILFKGKKNDNSDK